MSLFFPAVIQILAPSRAKLSSTLALAGALLMSFAVVPGGLYFVYRSLPAYSDAYLGFEEQHLMLTTCIAIGSTCVLWALYYYVYKIRPERSAK